MELHMSWASDELFNIDLGDERLNKRSVKILDALGGNPSISIPAACNGYHETKAAYRFFDNPDVKAKKILQPHTEATFKRIANEKIILCVQDTSEIDFTGQKENPGIGFLNTDNRRGLFLHPTLAITPDRICLGVIHAHTWRREKLRHHK